MSQAENTSIGRDFPITPEHFSGALESIGPNNITVINPEEYSMLASLTDEQARELPDGLYVIDETVRDRMTAAGVDYNHLNKAILDSLVPGEISEGDADRLKLTRQNSAHHVFFGAVRIQGEKAGPLNALVAVKPHIETEKGAAGKPFRELGNLALLQGMGHEGIYKPLGIVRSKESNFVVTEAKSGVKTLDNHRWYGDTNLFTERRKALTHQQLESLHGRDVEVIARVFELFGTVHAAGIFHGDAQMKNIGWTRERVASSPDRRASIGDDSSGVEDVNFTLIDLENAHIFSASEEDFGEDYYSLLAELAADDITKFMGSVPKNSRKPNGLSRKKASGEEGYNELFVELYLDAFFQHRGTVMGRNQESEDEQALRNSLRVSLLSQLAKIDNAKLVTVSDTSTSDNTTAALVG
jgi:hypothetical protein